MSSAWATPRQTVVQTEDVGGSSDVLYSSAGNVREDMYFNYGIFSFGWEVGGSVYDPTTERFVNGSFQPPWPDSPLISGHGETLEYANVELAFLATPGTRIELVAPTATNGPLYDFLQERGPGLHHIAYRVRDIRGALKELESQGCTLLDKAPRPGAHGTQIAFVHPRDFDGVLTELMEYES